MDPALDPPPLAAQPPAAVPAPPTATATVTVTAAAANPTPTQPPSHNHPPYAEMITAAISALNERDGSSKRAIAKYIETHYSNLPSTHAALLTHHLKRLKTNGQLLMVKYSYKLPRSAPASAANGAVSAVSSDPASSTPKRRPGRPPKPKPDAIQAPVPVFAPPVDMNAVPEVVNVVIGHDTVHVPVVPANGPAAGEVGPTPRRGRGRPPKQAGLTPPKQDGVKRKPGRPAKIVGPAAGGGGGRGRGRPKKNAAAPAAVAAPGKVMGRPRGRPPKPINVVEGLAPVGGGMAAVPVAFGVAPPLPAVGGATVPVTGKRRGRPPKNAALPKKPRKLSGRPVGRPKKNVDATVTRTPDSQLLVAYLDLKAKLENLQSRVTQAAILIRPSLNNEAAINALRELELVAMNANAPTFAQSPQQPQPEQPQHEQPQVQS